MDPSRIAELLQPFLAGPLSPAQLKSISTYIDVLLRWNARINLTAIRQPEEIVTRHFGESLFCAAKLVERGLLEEGSTLIDIGSGAGFPGLPIKIFAPEISLTLIESNNKKAAFLREVIRTLDWGDRETPDATVFAGRAEDFEPAHPNNVVTLRAVERFRDILPRAKHLAGPQGTVALFIGEEQVADAKTQFPKWETPMPIPSSSRRVLLLS